MGKLSRHHIIEAVIWLTLIGVFFAFSFEFNRPIEIYRFGATGWPWAILLLLLLAVVGNLYYHMCYGDAAEGGRIGAKADTISDEDGGHSWLSVLRLAAILLLPFAFALSLKTLGFFSAAPIFIVLIIMLFGETRWTRVVGITLLIYFLLLLFFVLLLNAPLPQGTVWPFYDLSHNILVGRERLLDLIR